MHIFKENENIGLLGGVGGRILYEHYNNKPDNVLYERFEYLFSKYSDKDIQLSFCNGISGINWLVNFLVERKTINIDSNEIFSEVDDSIILWTRIQLYRNNFDFLHGAIGTGIYFLSKSQNHKYKGFVEEIIFGLEKLAIKEENLIKYISPIKIAGKTELAYNLSLSHGISSIIVFLSLALKKNISAAKTKRLLEGCTNFLISTRNIEKIEGLSFFPTGIRIANGHKIKASRLAWCYGDLGIGMALYQAGINAKREDWVKISLEVLYNCTKRYDLKKNGVVDATICHGAAGIAHCYYRMYINTKEKVFYKSAKYWFDIVKQMKSDKNIQGCLCTCKGANSLTI
jgi:lantibiotic biosynthesis protein